MEELIVVVFDCTARSRSSLVVMNLFNCSQLIGFYLFNHPDIFGGGIHPSRIVMGIHPAATYTLDVYRLDIHVDFISVDGRDGHTGGSTLAPPLNQ